MMINFVGNYKRGYVGEVADETHLADNLEKLGCDVQQIPRDVWKAYCDGEWQESWEELMPGKADVNIICKWHHFNKPEYITKLREESEAPVLYWVWDYMYDDNTKDFINWHSIMAKEADLLLTNEGGLIPEYQRHEIKAYYFPFDVADESLENYRGDEPINVAFFGSHIKQGVRVSWLKKINKKIPVTIFAWNWKDWEKDGFKRIFPAVYGAHFNRQVSNINLLAIFS